MPRILPALAPPAPVSPTAALDALGANAIAQRAQRAQRERYQQAAARYLAPPQAQQPTPAHLILVTVHTACAGCGRSYTYPAGLLARFAGRPNGVPVRPGSPLARYASDPSVPRTTQVVHQPVLACAECWTPSPAAKVA